jgi:hypothetical protein
MMGVKACAGIRDAIAAPPMAASIAASAIGRAMRRSTWTRR